MYNMITNNGEKNMNNLGLDAEYFNDKEKAREYLEQVRWGNDPVCPHCGNCDKVYKLQG